MPPAASPAPDTARRPDGNAAHKRRMWMGVPTRPPGGWGVGHTQNCFSSGYDPSEADGEQPRGRPCRWGFRLVLLSSRLTFLRRPLRPVTAGVQRGASGWRSQALPGGRAQGPGISPAVPDGPNARLAVARSETNPHRPHRGASAVPEARARGARLTLLGQPQPPSLPQESPPLGNPRKLGRGCYSRQRSRLPGAVRALG